MDSIKRNFPIIAAATLLGLIAFRFGIIPIFEIYNKKSDTVQEKIIIKDINSFKISGRDYSIIKTNNNAWQSAEIKITGSERYKVALRLSYMKFADDSEVLFNTVDICRVTDDAIYGKVEKGHINEFFEYWEEHKSGLE